MKPSAWGHTAEPGSEPTSDSRACAALPPIWAWWACPKLKGEFAINELTLESTQHSAWHIIHIQNGTPIRRRVLQLHTTVRKKISHTHLNKEGRHIKKGLWDSVYRRFKTRQSYPMVINVRRLGWKNRTFLICVPVTGTCSLCDNSLSYISMVCVLFWNKVYTSMKNCGFLFFLFILMIKYIWHKIDHLNQSSAQLRSGKCTSH